MEKIDMSVKVVTYNKLLVKYGVILSYVGLGILFLNAVAYIWEKYGMGVVFVALFFLFTGSFMVNYYIKKTKQVGFILIGESTTKIHVGLSDIEIINSEFSVKFSKTGYKGKSNYKPFMTLGAFTTNPGINTICFYNKLKKFNYDIILKSESEYKKLSDIISNNYRG